MIVYWILLLIIAFPAYYIGSISTLRVASRFVFRKNLRRLGKGSAWVSNFKRIFGWWGFGKLLLTEVVKDLIPILLGAAVLAVKHHAAVGAAFGGYCMLVGRLWPMFNNFRGTHHGCVALVVAALSVIESVNLLSVAAPASKSKFVQTSVSAHSLGGSCGGVNLTVGTCHFSVIINDKVSRCCFFCNISFPVSVRINALHICAGHAN